MVNLCVCVCVTVSVVPVALPLWEGGGGSTFGGRIPTYFYGWNPPPPTPLRAVPVHSYTLGAQFGMSYDEHATLM